MISLSVQQPERVLWRQDGLTRGDLAAYLSRVAGPLLAFARNRPLALLRAPEGPERAFLQRDVELLLQSRRDLALLPDCDALALHAEPVQLAEPERPDLLIFDLDPSEAPFARVKEAALGLRASLGGRGLRSFVKTSGGRGLHLVVPIRPDLRHDAVRAAARSLAAEALARAPGLLTLASRRTARTGKVFLDLTRNAERALLAAPWSPREYPGAPVSTPLRWEELEALADPRALDLRSVPDRLDRGGDPWAELFDEPHELAPVAQALAMSGARRATA